MNTLHIFGLLVWLILIAAVVGFASLNVRAFLDWPGVTRHGRLVGLLIRALVIAAVLAIVIGVPLDLANL